MLLYTYISRFSVNPQHQQMRKIRRNCRHKFYPQPLLIAFFNFARKQPTFAFTSESGYTLGFRGRIAHKGSHDETQGISDGALSLPSDCFTRFGNPAWPGVRTAYFAVFGSWPEGAPKERREPSGQRCAYVRRGPAGLRDPVSTLLIMW